MAAQKGLEILVKRGNAATPEVFTALAGLRTKSVQMNKETVDVTSADDTSRWRQLLAGAGIKSFSISGSGVLKDNQVMKDMVDDSLDDTFVNYQVIIPGIGTFEGPFQATCSYAGDHNAEATYDLTLESAGDLEFDPA